MNTSITLAHTTRNKTMVAFDGKTYFIKFQDQHMASWYPVKTININLNGDCRVIGAYGWNCGRRSPIVNRKGQDVTKRVSFNINDLGINNKVKLYSSSVITEIVNVYPLEMLEEARSFNNRLDTFRQLASLSPDDPAILALVPDEFKKYM